MANMHFVSMGIQQGKRNSLKNRPPAFIGQFVTVTVYARGDGRTLLVGN